MISASMGGGKRPPDSSGYNGGNIFFGKRNKLVKGWNKIYLKKSFNLVKFDNAKLSYGCHTMLLVNLYLFFDLRMFTKIILQIL